METRKGKILIEITGNAEPVIFFEPVDNNVWMSLNEVCDLFGVYMNAVKGTLDILMRKTRFDANQSCKFHRCISKGRICYDITDVDLEVIITLSFYIDSFYAKALREWAIERLIKPPKQRNIQPEKWQDWFLN